MASRRTLSPNEISLIKGMLKLRPRLTYQQILSYFSYPGRDLNHRIIPEIRYGFGWGIPAATEVETRRFMAAFSFWRPPVSLHPTPTARYRRFIGHLHLDWWPVGQGLFSSGAIIRPDAEPIAWVYDCGNARTDPVLQEALNEFASASRSRGIASLRLGVLSHFDHDHISGFVRLLALFPVRSLLLPYVPAWRRILIALGQGIGPGDPLWPFFLNPTAYLLQAGEGRIGEILYVQSGIPDDLPDDGTSDPLIPVPSAGGEDGRRDTKDDWAVDEGGPLPEAADDPALTAVGRVRVSFLAPGGRLTVSNLWEFVPYNDGGLAHRLTPAFVQRTETLLRALLDPTRTDHDRVLAILKKHYSRRFPPPHDSNVISLYLYSGPVSAHLVLAAPCDNRLAPMGDLDRFSQMLTGDACLKDPARLNAFNRFYARGRRLSRSAFLQVPHHGSKSNWQPGLAARLAPSVSLFCSDPVGHYKHPHADVLRDFWTCSPVQVDEDRGYHLSGLLCL